MVSLADNRWRLEALTSAVDVESVVKTWRAPVIDRERDTPESVYTAECHRLAVKPNKRLVGELRSAAPMTTLDLSTNFVGSVGILPVLAALPLMRQLVSVDLRWCQILSAHVTLLAATVASMPSVTTLRLSDNPFASLGVVALLEAAQKNRSLSSIYDEMVDVVPTLLRKLERQLKANPDLAAKSEVTPRSWVQRLPNQCSAGIAAVVLADLCHWVQFSR
ncbi:hypothetical protein DIPPA_19359 [Diplonema papillatum]|nr:hypothetical protein DIPPA_19359 [Diplonema papillatum]